MPRLSVSRFAAACGISAAAVRRYADTGVLPLAHVEVRTGDRCYDPEQVPAGVLLRLLRELGVSSATARAVLAHPDPAGRLQLLEEHRHTVTTQAREALATRDHLARVLGGWQEQVGAIGVTTGDLPATAVLVRRRTASLWTYADVVQDGRARLLHRAREAGWQTNGSLTSTYAPPDQADDAGGEDQRVIELLLPVCRASTTSGRTAGARPSGVEAQTAAEGDADGDAAAALPAGLLGTAAVLLGVFLLRQRVAVESSLAVSRGAPLLIGREALRDRDFLRAVAVALVNTATVSASGTVLALMAAERLQLGPVATGLLLLPFSVAVVVGARPRPRGPAPVAQPLHPVRAGLGRPAGTVPFPGRRGTSETTSRTRAASTGTSWTRVALRCPTMTPPGAGHARPGTVRGSPAVAAAVPPPAGHERSRRRRPRCRPAGSHPHRQPRSRFGMHQPGLLSWALSRHCGACFIRPST